MIETRATVHGYPRMGPNRELKSVTEGYWAGRVPAAELRQAAPDCAATPGSSLAAAGLDEVPVNDFSLYDHVLDTTRHARRGPARHATAVPDGRRTGPRRATSPWPAARQDVAPLEMTKWFDTNYHYLVPELGPDTASRSTRPSRWPSSQRPASSAFAPARCWSARSPTSLLAKPAADAADGLRAADPARPAAAACTPRCSPSCARPAPSGCSSTSRPCVQDRTAGRAGRRRPRLPRARPRSPTGPKLLVASYFDRLGEALPVLAKAPVDGLALDFTGPAAANLRRPRGRRRAARQAAGRRRRRRPQRLDQRPRDVAGHPRHPARPGRPGRRRASCSLLHVPLDAAGERGHRPAGRPLARLRPAEDRRGRHARPRARPAAPTPSRPNSPPTAPIWRPAPPRRSPSTRPSAPGPPPSPTPTRRALQPYPSRRRGPAGRVSACRCCRRPPSARSRRPPNCAGPAPTCARGGIDTAGYERAHRGRDPRGHRLPGEGRPRRPGARRARTQRHGPVLRRAADRLPRHPARLGPVLRHPLRPPADPRRRHLPARADDRALDRVRPVADRPPGQGHAHRPGHHARLVLRPRRPAARRHRTPGRARPARRGGRPGGSRDAVIQVDEPALRETLPLRAADRRGVPGLGDRGVPARHQRRARRTPRSTPTCATPNSATSSQAIDDLDADVISLEAARSHMQVAGELAARRLPARGRPRRLRHPLPARARRRRGRRPAARRDSKPSPPSGSGSTPTAA